MDQDLVLGIRRIIEEFPTYGVRRIHAVLKFRDGLKVNRKRSTGSSSSMAGKRLKSPEACAPGSRDEDT
ncbi:IS3 family transposase [Oligoflexus tunisiensis]|uniref:IS3 family transposase n=1 Tax=Oligoflexus tunisiensis TaxID=708132 RepID=UPI00350E42FC